MKKNIDAYYTERFPKCSGLRAMLCESAAKHGNKPLFRFVDSSNEVNEISYASFAAQVDAIGTAYSALGFAGKRIAILCESRPEWVMTYIAVIHLGGVIIPLDKDLLPEQIKNFLEMSDTYALIYSKTLEKKVDIIKPELDSVKHFVLMNRDCIYDSFEETQEQLDEMKNKRDVSFSILMSMGKTLLQGGLTTFSLSKPDIHKMAAIIFTSGTTGTSKGVMLSQNNVLSCIYVSANRTCFNENDELLSVLPFHHTYETCCGILTPICIGMTVNINNSLKYVMKNLLRFKPTGLVLVPLFVSTIYKKIAAEIRSSGKQKSYNRGVKITTLARKVGIDLRSRVFSSITLALGGRLKKVICGGAPLDPDLVTRFDELGINLSQGYGITECAPLVSVNTYYNLKHGSVGPPVYENSVKIALYSSDGSVTYAPANTVGEVYYKGPNLMLGYFNDAQATSEAFTENGYFKTGDLGYLDDEGYLYLTGRKKNVIILANGKNIYPEEIEEYIYKLDVVKECAVVAREVGEELVITAIIYPDYSLPCFADVSKVSDIIKAEIMAVNKKLPIFKQIRNIEIKKSEFEKSSTNKIIRYKL